MKKKIWSSVLLPLLLLSLPFILGQCCVLPGTGTIHVINYISDPHAITSLYVYPAGSPDTSNDIGGPMHNNDYHDVKGLEPGQWTVHAVINSGEHNAEETVAVTEGTVTLMAFTDAMVY